MPPDVTRHTTTNISENCHPNAVHGASDRRNLRIHPSTRNHVACNSNFMQPNRGEIPPPSLDIHWKPPPHASLTASHHTQIHPLHTTIAMHAVTMFSLPLHIVGTCSPTASHQIMRPHFSTTPLASPDHDVSSTNNPSSHHSPSTNR
jgi:hypothetical protein